MDARDNQKREQNDDKEGEGVQPTAAVMLSGSDEDQARASRAGRTSPRAERAPTLTPNNPPTASGLLGAHGKATLDSSQDKDGGTGVEATGSKEAAVRRVRRSSGKTRLDRVTLLQSDSSSSFDLLGCFRKKQEDSSIYSELRAILKQQQSLRKEQAKLKRDQSRIIKKLEKIERNNDRINSKLESFLARLEVDDSETGSEDEDEEGQSCVGTEHQSSANNIK